MSQSWSKLWPTNARIEYGVQHSRLAIRATAVPHMPSNKNKTRYFCHSPVSCAVYSGNICLTPTYDVVRNLTSLGALPGVNVAFGRLRQALCHIRIISKLYSAVLNAPSMVSGAARAKLIYLGMTIRAIRVLLTNLIIQLKP